MKKKYALKLSSKDNRILSACVVLPNGIYKNMPIVESLPEGSIVNYKYVDGEFIHDPPTEPIVGEELPEHIKKLFPKRENKPSQLDIIEAQVTYTALMTDTLLPEV